MATLTGYKAVGEPEQVSGGGGPQQQQRQTNGGGGGQQNPVFVFDDVDVGPDNNQVDSNEIFVDAPSDVSSSAPVISKQQKHSTITTTGSIGDRTAMAPDVAIEMNHETRTKPPSNGTDGHGPEPTKRVTSATGNQIQKGVQQGEKQQVSAVAPAAAATTTTPPATQQVHQQASTPATRPATQNSLSPHEADGDNTSVSMLAIDCVGKSPRQPRRSPLMALFKGKPRESVRRLYTDEDQFEIEWANLSLEFQKKWYQKLGGLLTGGGDTNDSKAMAQNNATKNNNNNLGSDDFEKSSGVNRPQSKLILNGVDGRIRSGEITAILGPSGAGKTSLLNGLFGKYRTMVQGSIKVTGAPSKKRLTVCTIPQSDYLIGYLTTEESLWFASRLKNCECDFDHTRNIERVIELLGLQRCRHTRINKLSGGQYKRVSIAQEMLSSPDILVLDEPTSGLDSLTCYRTVKVLRDLTEASKAHNLVNPMSIILTIHQPHRDVLDLFHSVYVMAVGGQTLYQGPPSDMEDWINKHSGTTMPSKGYNPASFMVELASEEYGRKPIEALVGRQREKFRQTTKHQYKYELPKISNENLSQSQNHHDHHSHAAAANNSRSKQNMSNKADSTITLYPLDDGKYVDIDLNEHSSGGSNKKQTTTMTTNNGYKDIDYRIMTPRSGKNSDGVFLRHVNLMSKRCFLSNFRDPLLFTMRVGAHLFIPLIVALIYGPKMGIPNGCPFYMPEINLLEYASVGVEEIEGKHDDIRIQFQNVGLHFMVYYAFALCMLAFTAISFPLIMHVLVKEIRNGWYSLSTFIVGKMIAELPMALVLPPISVGIIYYLTGQPASLFQWRYCVQSVILILLVMIAEAKGLIFGAICMNSMQTAVFAASVSTVPLILLSGFLIRIREVPYLLQHLARFSYFKHAVEALIITRYGFGMCPCDQALIPPGGTPKIVGIPQQIMSLTDYYVNSYVGQGANATGEQEEATTTETNVLGNNRNISRIVNSITSLSPDTITEPSLSGSENSDGEARSKREAAAAAPSDDDEPEAEEKPGSTQKQGVFFNKLAALLTRANAFGFTIMSCEDVEPFTMKDMRLKDAMLPPLMGYLTFYIVILKFISYYIVEICLKLKL